MSEDLQAVGTDDLLGFVAAIEEKMHEFRSEVQRLDREVVKARVVLSEKISAWQLGGHPKMTHAELVKDYCASETEKRQLRKEGLLPSREQPVIANSVIDRMRAPAPIGPNSAAYHRQRNGFNRGAYPRQAKGVKLPSER